MLSSVVIKAVVTSVIGALASLWVERAWRRHKAKQQQTQESKN